MENENILIIKDLDVRLFTDRGELPVIDRLSLTLKAGETLGIVGESGCGKSMLASAIMGLVAHPGKVTGGSIQFEGQELVGMKKKDLRRIRGTGISMIFQEPMTSLNPLMTCGRQIVETITSHEKMNKAEAKERALCHDPFRWYCPPGKGVFRGSGPAFRRYAPAYHDCHGADLQTEAADL